jgi:hypothetical protein
MVAICDGICAEYAGQGYGLSVRQLYYQLVGRGLFPDDRRFTKLASGRWVRDPEGTKNAEPNYLWLKDLASKGRLAGWIDWNHLDDRTRAPHINWYNSTPDDAIQSMAGGYQEDPLKYQGTHLEVWVEKDALVEVVQRGCEAREVPYFACKGYVSQSAMYRAAKRLERAQKAGKDVRLIYLGDHDPSGLDMARDIPQRLTRFMVIDGFDPITFERIALTQDQIFALNPPSDPAKQTDSRFERYVEETGLEDAWELDALDPAFLANLISTEVERWIDADAFTRAQEESDGNREVLEAVAGRWDDVRDFLGYA